MDLVIFGKFAPYEVDPVVFRQISHVYERYKGRHKNWESHKQPVVLLSQLPGKVLTKVTAAEKADVVGFTSDTLKTRKRAICCKRNIDATYIHCLTTDVLRYCLITVDPLEKKINRPKVTVCVCISLSPQRLQV